MLSAAASICSNHIHTEIEMLTGSVVEMGEEQSCWCIFFCWKGRIKELDCTHTVVLPRKKNKSLQDLWTCLYITVLSALCTSSNPLQTKPVSVPGSPDKLCGMTLWITPLIHYTLPTQIPHVNVDRAVFNDSNVSKNIASLSVFQPKEQSQLQNSRALYYTVTDNMKLFQSHDTSVGALHFRHRLQWNLTLKTLLTLPLVKSIMGKKVKTHQNTSTKVKEHFYLQGTKHALLHKSRT